MNGINGIKSLTVQFFLKLAVAVISFVPRPWTPSIKDGGGESPLGMVQACDWDGKLAILLGQGVKIQPHMRRHRCV